MCVCWIDECRQHMKSFSICKFWIENSIVTRSTIVDGWSSAPHPAAKAITLPRSPSHPVTRLGALFAPQPQALCTPQNSGAMYPRNSSALRPQAPVNTFSLNQFLLKSAHVGECCRSRTQQRKLQALLCTGHLCDNSLKCMQPITKAWNVLNYVQLFHR